MFRRKNEILFFVVCLPYYFRYHKFQEPTFFSANIFNKLFFIFRRKNEIYFFVICLPYYLRYHKFQEETFFPPTFLTNFFFDVCGDKHF